MGWETFRTPHAVFVLGVQTAEQLKLHMQSLFRIIQQIIEPFARNLAHSWMNTPITER